MDSITQAYKSAWERLIKPPTIRYADHDVGPEVIFTQAGNRFVRQSMKIVNAQG